MDFQASKLDGPHKIVAFIALCHGIKFEILACIVSTQKNAQKHTSSCIASRHPIQTPFHPQLPFHRQMLLQFLQQNIGMQEI